MGQTPEACLDPAQDDGGFLIGLPDQVAVDHAGIVRTFPHLAARRIGIGLPVLFRYAVVIHHRVHIAGRHEEAEPGFAKDAHASRIPPVRLGNDPHAVAVGFQHPAYYGGAKRRMVYIGVAGHIGEIHPVPSAGQHIFSVYG